MYRTYIDVAKLVDVLSGALPKTTKVGFAYDANGRPHAGFVATNRETDKVREFGKAGMHYGINWRSAR